MLKRILLHITKLCKNQKGQGLAEYSILMAFLALIVVAGIIGFGNRVLEIYNNILNTIASLL